MAKTSRIIGCSHSVISTSSSSPVTSRAAAAMAVPNLPLLLLARLLLLVCKPLPRSKPRQLGRKDGDLAPAGTCEFCETKMEDEHMHELSHRQGEGWVFMSG